MISGTVHLKAKEERRILRGHLWVFSNEIARIEGDPAPGALVEVRSSSTRLIGTATYNRHSLITCRLLSRERIEDLGVHVRSAVLAANERRVRLGFAGAWRMVYGESDNLPGLVIDRYGDAAVIESFSAGGDAMLAHALRVLVDDLGLASVVERSGSVWRGYEGIEMRSGVLHGSLGAVDVDIEGIRYRIDLAEGQKTGFFLDQRENRLFVEQISRDASVLDLFCNDGGFSLHAARGGAREVMAVDISAGAIERVRHNALLNSVSTIDTATEDVFAFVDRAREQGRVYDVVVVDPPSFVKNRRNIATGLKGYRKLNERALGLVRSGGWFVTCSCSQHVSEEMFLDMLREASARAGRRVTLVRISGAAADHPILLAMPETRYLCCVAGLVDG